MGHKSKRIKKSSGDVQIQITDFKSSFKHFKRKDPAPDLNNVVDVRIVKFKHYFEEVVPKQSDNKIETDSQAPQLSTNDSDNGVFDKPEDFKDCEGRAERGHGGEAGGDDGEAAGGVGGPQVGEGEQGEEWEEQEKSVLVMGRGFNFATCLEGALVSPKNN